MTLYIQVWASSPGEDGVSPTSRCLRAVGVRQPGLREEHHLSGRGSSRGGPGGRKTSGGILEGQSWRRGSLVLCVNLLQSWPPPPATRTPSCAAKALRTELRRRPPPADGETGRASDLTGLVTLSNSVFPEGFNKTQNYTT